jgi:anti-anti-sigma factor
VAAASEIRLNGRVISDRPSATVHYVVRSDGDTPVITVAGELDMSNADTLRLCLQVFDRGDHVALNLAELEFIDSSGIGVLAEAHGRGVRICARRAQHEVRKALDICGLAGVILVDEDAGTEGTAPT